MATATRTYTRPEIYEGVRDILVEALSVDEGDVVEDARLISDLGAESIDFMDIEFRLEKRFNIKIGDKVAIRKGSEHLPPYGIEDSRAQQPDRDFYNNDRISAIRSQYPHADLTIFESEPSWSNLRDTITVGSVVKYLESRLNQ